MKIKNPPEFENFKEFFNTVVSKSDPEKYNALRDFYKDILLSETSEQNGVKYVETSSVMNILSQDPLEMANNFIKEEMRDDVTDQEINDATIGISLLSIHIKSMMESIVAEINCDLTRDSSYKDIISFLENSGYRVIYDDRYMEEVVEYYGNENPEKFHKGKGAVIHNLNNLGDGNYSYDVEKRNMVFYNDDLGAVVSIEGDFEGLYSPKFNFYAETNKSPNRFKVQASSSPVDFHDAFSISLNVEQVNARIQRLLENGVRFNKEWKTFKYYPFDFENKKFEDVLVEINKNHPDVIKRLFESNVEDFYYKGRLISVNSFLSDVSQRYVEFRKIVGEIPDKLLEDTIQRLMMFESFYRPDSKVGWFGVEMIDFAKSKGFDENDLYEYAKMIKSEAMHRLEDSQIRLWSYDKMKERIFDKLSSKELLAFLETKGKEVKKIGSIEGSLHNHYWQKFVDLAKERLGQSSKPRLH